MKFTEALTHIREAVDTSGDRIMEIDREILIAIVEALPNPQFMSETANVYVAPSTDDVEMDAIAAILIVLKYLDENSARRVAKYITLRTWGASVEGGV